MARITDNERNHYVKHAERCIFTTPEDELVWAQSNSKECTKCKEIKTLDCYTGNTSGSDPFDKDGYRLRRPECSVCTKVVSAGKSAAMKCAKTLGIPYKAPEGTTCSVCGCLPSRGNGLVFDHCHKMNVFRGYACNSCNRSMGVLGDDVDGLLRVLNYLNKFEGLRVVQGEDGVLRKVE